MASMPVVVGRTLGPPDGYTIEDQPIPEPGRGQVRVRIAAVGIGYVDALLAAGRYQIKPQVPFTPGTEFAGTIDSVGSDIGSWSVGDRVSAVAFGGGFAAFACVDAASLQPLPESVPFNVGAVYRVNFATALHALKDRAGLRSGETLLVLGAAGGTGLAAIQIGRMMGAHVIAAASSEEKRALALQHGAALAIDYSQDDWRTQLKKATAGRSVDVVFDPVAADKLEPAFRSLAWGGRHLVIGFAGGPIPALPVNLALLKGAALMGVDMRQFTAKEPHLALENERALVAYLKEGRINPVVGPIYPFEAFATALTDAAHGHVLGKIVLQIAP